MESNTTLQHEIIQTIQVYSEKQQVFVKNQNENWFPISFQWVKLN